MIIINYSVWNPKTLKSVIGRTDVYIGEYENIKYET